MQEEKTEDREAADTLMGHGVRNQRLCQSPIREAEVEGMPAMLLKHQEDKYRGRVSTVTYQSLWWPGCSVCYLPVSQQKGTKKVMMMWKESKCEFSVFFSVVRVLSRM